MKKLLVLILTIGAISVLSAKQIDIEGLQNSCESSNPNANSCALLADMYKLGHQVDKDFNMAFIYYQESCDLNSARGCFGLGLSYRNSLVYKDEILANEAMKKACGLGYKLACEAVKKDLK